MRGYLSRFWRRSFAPRDRQDREAAEVSEKVCSPPTPERQALEQIAARVWGRSDAPRRLSEAAGVAALLRDVEARIPAAVEGYDVATRVVVEAIGKETPIRFRAIVSGVELGVFVDGRNAWFTLLAASGGRAEGYETAVKIWDGIALDADNFHEIEASEESLDGSGRPCYWVRFAGSGA